MELYNGRLDKTPGAIALRHRWYGTGTPELGEWGREGRSEGMSECSQGGGEGRRKSVERCARE